MARIALFPGSFDPITKGHESIIHRALPLFDKVIVGVGVNADKQSFFPIEQRVGWIRALFVDNPKVEVIMYEGLTVDVCKEHGATYILRGLRTAADFEFERMVGQINKKLQSNLETVYLLTLPEHTTLNSSIVREIYKYGGDISQFVPETVNPVNSLMRNE
ncbi:MAG: pantetheine-phosphate adenylyltransferase [Bacteroidetes bacterium]|nr:MAG: pantetheine-phosphate adenylyltransferase [Bacteroidota bacterium]PIE88027.1 MAG: pantetheine-phosphate adenylyltransferase [Bacteroidota bacterium]